MRRRIQISAPGYPNPGALSRPWRYFLLASLLAGGPLLAMHNPLGWLCAIPLVIWWIVTGRRAQRMRYEALTALEASAPTMPPTEVEQRIETILRIYGGKPFPSVRRHITRIRDRTSN
jgi:hypothetical protein